MVDDITGLPTRRALFKRLEALEAGSEATVAIFDIDDFRFVNLSHGYVVGDKVLKATGRYFKQVFSRYFPSFYLARTGPNQFTLLIEGGAPPLKVEELFKKYFNTISFRLKREIIRVTLSGGVSSGRDRFPEIFFQAENALYSAKNGGKNTIVIHEPSRLRDIAKFREIRYKLLEAIRRGSVYPYFQPIVSLRTGEVYGYEVLSRIYYKGQVLSGDYVFLVADSLALTPDIDRALFLNTIKYFGDYKLFINLSMKYFFKELTSIFQIAKEHSLDLSNVIFEITETQRLMDERVAVSFFQLFKEFSAGIAIDDFGAGYSNFMYLKKFPVDVVKIDGSFVKGAIRDVKDLTIVKSIVDVARAFKVRTLAEYIESEEIFRLMRSVGVSLGQGYFIGEPKPEPERVKVEI